MPKRTIFVLALIASLTASLFPLFAYDYREFPSIVSVSPPNFSVIYGDRTNISGIASSHFKIVSVEIDKQKALLKFGVFELPGLPLVLGKNIFLIKATDIFGNRKNFRYTIYRENPPAEPAPLAEAINKIPETEIPVDLPKAEGFTAPQQAAEAVKPPVTKGLLSGTTPVQTYTNTAYTTDTASNVAQTYQAAASPVAADPVAAPPEQSNGKSIVVFSSPYNKQVIMEDMLLIGGSFDSSANATAITVNDQPCTLDNANSTFTGPMLISPGKAKSKNITSDSKEYILMKVNPDNHSGENTLEVVVTNNMGRASKEKITYYYYQMFVNMRADARYTMKDDMDGQTYVAPEHIMMFNPNLYYQTPEDPYFHDWQRPDKNYREFWYDHCSESYQDATKFYSGHYEYYSIEPFYTNYANSFSWFWFFMDPSEMLATPPGHFSTVAHEFFDTPETLHAPPFKGLPFIVLFRNCYFLENNPFFSQPPNPTPQWNALQLNLNEYKVLGQPLKPLYGNFGKPLSSEDILKGNCTYVAIEDFVPDADFQLKVDMPKNKDEFWGGGKMWSSFFGAKLEYGMTGDILVDSNNDGFLGGEDNAVEQVAPGCVFWVNDDDDYDESPVHQDDADAVNSQGNDGSDEYINGIRDLEDFMPIDLTIVGIKEWTKDKNVKFILKTEGSGRIKVFRRVNDNDEEGTKTYLLDLEEAKQQYKEEIEFSLPDKDGKNEIELDPSLFNQEGKFYGIFEGVEKGQLKLSLEVELGLGQGKKRVILDEVYITLKDVRDMYRFINIRKGPTESNEDNKLRYRDIKIEKSDMFIKDPSVVTIFIHGAWTPIDDAVSWSSMLYKRLYRTGYRGGFVGIAWHSDEIGAPILQLLNPKLTFDNEWVNSFQSGQVIADVIKNTKNEFRDAKIEIVAHSLGGNLISYALKLLAYQDEKKLVNDVFLIQVAVPGNAYGGHSEKDYFKDMYLSSIENNISGEAYNLFYNNDETLNWFGRDLAGDFPSYLLGRKGLPIPLDDNYELLSSNQMYPFYGISYYGYKISRSRALGSQDIISSSSNFKSKSFYGGNLRPYGIRNHLSFGEEYYYDMKVFYEKMLEAIKN